METFTTNYVIEIFSGVLTPIIALLALYIAYQQYRTNKQKFLYETYEKRLEIYNEVQEYLASILREANSNYKRLSEYSIKTSQAVFLFDKKIQLKIDEIFKKSVEMIRLQEKLYPNGTNNGLPVGEERSRVSHENSELVQWHVDQLRETKRLFSKRMALK